MNYIILNILSYFPGFCNRNVGCSAIETVKLIVKCSVLMYIHYAFFVIGLLSRVSWWWYMWSESDGNISNCRL